MLVKYHAGEPQASEDDLRAELERHGLEVGRLEREGRFRFAEEPGDRTEALNHLLDNEAGQGRSVWASFNWTKRVDLDEALSQQEALTELVEGAQLVVNTAVLEDTAEAWTLKEQRKAQGAHSGTIWLSERGLALSRVTPLPAN